MQEEGNFKLNTKDLQNFRVISLVLEFVRLVETTLNTETTGLPILKFFVDMNLILVKVTIY